MRKALLVILMATALATPAFAQEVQDMPENYRRQMERNQADVERQEARAAARAERQAERVQERVQRQPDEQRVERRQERIERQSAQPSMERVEQRSDAERSIRREERQERRADRREQRGQREDVESRIAREQAQRVYPADMPENYRRQWDRNEAGVARSEAQRDVRRDYRRDRRDWNNGGSWSDNNRNWSGSRSRWDRSWRQDSRYDWQRYRYSNRGIFRPGPYYSPYRNYGYNRFSIGITLGRDFYSNRYWINDPWQYRLPQPYAGTRWVRYHNDVLLVDTFNGQVLDVIYDFFW